MSAKHQPCGNPGCLNCLPLIFGDPAQVQMRNMLAPRTAKEAIQNMSEQDYKIITLEATVAQQAAMIEHLRGGPTPLYTAVDMANAARDGFRDGAASVVVELPKTYPLDETFHSSVKAAYNDGVRLCQRRIIAAGGRVKE